MSQTTKPRTWPTDKRLVVYMVPSERAEDYGTMMSLLTAIVQKDLKWDPDTIELVGLIAATAEHGTEGIFFLEEFGVHTREITLLMLWGETAASAHMEKAVSEECGIGTIILPETGVVLPTIRMPSIEGDWWLDPLHQEFAAVSYSILVESGRDGLDGTEPYTFIALPYTWN